MNAIICDRCGKLWKDTKNCEVEMKELHLNKGNSLSERIGSYDLCKDCYNGLFDYLKSIKKEKQ